MTGLRSDSEWAQWVEDGLTRVIHGAGIAASVHAMAALMRFRPMEEREKIVSILRKWADMPEGGDSHA